ncbi:MAG: hypothetical protein M0T85_08580 [Dehalococcoidales bacterium]|nr:hypothetical protein [Dehalococcoidales bacterium]
MMAEFGNATIGVLDPPNTTSIGGTSVPVTGNNGTRARTGWCALVVLPDGTERWVDRHQLFCWVAQRMGQWMLGGNEYPVSNPDLSHLLEARDALVARLENGTQLIEGSHKRGRKAPKSEALWLELLEMYELTEQQIALFS